MWLRWWAVLILLALLLVAAIFSSRIRSPLDAVAYQCVGIYAEGLPAGVRVARAEEDGRDLVVRIHHLGWTGEIRCVLYRDGSLDDIGTLNEDMEVHWSEPPMPLNP